MTNRKAKPMEHKRTSKPNNVDAAKQKGDTAAAAYAPFHAFDEVQTTVSNALHQATSLLYLLLDGVANHDESIAAALSGVSGILSAARDSIDGKDSDVVRHYLAQRWHDLLEEERKAQAVELTPDERAQVQKLNSSMTERQASARKSKHGVSTH